MMKFKSIILAFIPFLLLGCNDLFDKGDVEKSYDGPPIVGFFPLQAEANLSDGSISIEVQLIAKEARSSDLPVAFHVNAEETTAVEGVHYTISTSRSEEHTSELQSRGQLVCRLLLEKKKINEKEKNEHS